MVSRNGLCGPNNICRHQKHLSVTPRSKVIHQSVNLVAILDSAL